MAQRRGHRRQQPAGRRRAKLARLDRHHRGRRAAAPVRPARAHRRRCRRAAPAASPALPPAISGWDEPGAMRAEPGSPRSPAARGCKPPGIQAAPCPAVPAAACGRVCRGSPTQMHVRRRAQARTTRGTSSGKRAGRPMRAASAAASSRASRRSTRAATARRAARRPARRAGQCRAGRRRCTPRSSATAAASAPSAARASRARRAPRLPAPTPGRRARGHVHSDATACPAPGSDAVALNCAERQGAATEPCKPAEWGTSRRPRLCTG